MVYVKAYLGTLVAFLAIDAVWLGVIARNYYSEQIGHLMRDSPNWAAAAMFYLVYIGGVVFLAVNPAMSAGSWKTAALYGAVVGALAYGTYDFTNYATLRDWPGGMVAIDILWGTALTAVASVAGLIASRLGG